MVAEPTPVDLSGSSFLSAEVVNLYAHRPPYAAGIYPFLSERAPRNSRLLDLGCGEGKIARPMAKRFEEVVAVDPSAKMIALGQSLENGQATNIDWVVAKAEDAPIKGSFDIATFGSSIHWMDPECLFAKLKGHLRPKHLVAIVSGDEPFEPSWDSEFQRFLAKWVPEVTGRALGSKEWQATRIRHLDYLDIQETLDFVSDPFEQTVHSFVLCQHSRNTFTLSRLGTRAAEFQKELEHILKDHTNTRGMLSYRVKTRVTVARLPT